MTQEGEIKRGEGVRGGRGEGGKRERRTASTRCRVEDGRGQGERGSKGRGAGVGGGEWGPTMWAKVDGCLKTNKYYR